MAWSSNRTQRRRTAALAPGLLLVASCNFDPTGFGAVESGATDAAGIPDARTGDGGSAIDAAGIDGDITAPDAAVYDAATADAGGGADASGCPGDVLPFEPSNLPLCDIPAPQPPINLSPASIYTLDTDTGELSTPLLPTSALVHTVVPQAAAPDIFVVSTESLSIPALTTLRVRGQRAVAFVSFGDVTIAGTLDVGARGADSGAGGDHDAACAAGRGANGSVQVVQGDQAGSGGGGGGFATAGGAGAIVDNSSGDPTAGGLENGNSTITPLRGGCAGGNGGNGSGGPGGGAGGALQLVVGGSLRVENTGAITARGGGGRAVTGAFGGGGGGGSGGAILLEVPSAQIMGAVTANGGGGAEGSRTGPFSDSGDDGKDKTAFPAPGGSGLSYGGNGGSGGSALSESKDGIKGYSDKDKPAGGGGGGGSAGRIHLRAESSANVTGGAVISPALQ